MKIKDVDQYRESILPANVAHPESVSREQSEVEFLAGNLPNFDIAAHSMFRAVLTLRGWRSDQLLNDALLHCEVPTLFVWGDQDAIAPPETGLSFAERMASARFETVEGAGHIPWMDQPEPVAAALNRFF